MQFLEDIKHKIGKWAFQRELKTNKRQKYSTEKIRKTNSHSFSTLHTLSLINV